MNTKYWRKNKLYNSKNTVYNANLLENHRNDATSLEYVASKEMIYILMKGINQVLKC
jgi:hypothetical protein